MTEMTARTVLCCCGPLEVRVEPGEKGCRIVICCAPESGGDSPIGRANCCGDEPSPDKE